MAEHMDYRLAFILPESRQLLGIKCSGTAELPCISIPMWERAAEQLTRLIEERWQIKTIVLDVLAGDSSAPPVAVIEVRGSSLRLEREELRPTDPNIVNRSSLGEYARHTLVSILSGDDDERSPFSRLGWIDEVKHWIRDAVRNREVEFTENILQLNACGRFALVRFGTEEGPAYWLKAVGTPNEHEFEITKTLGERFPTFLPTIVAMRDDWNAWVMEETGQPLGDSFALPSIERAVVSLAELQRKSIDHVNPLLAAGCLGRSIPVIEAHLGEITEYLEDAMSRQTSTKVPRIEVHRLRELKRILRDACFRMQDLGLPDTLIHNDINAGNILLSGSRCVFIDWAEAYVGNPLMTVQLLLVGVVKSSEEAHTWIRQLKSLYKTQWLDITDGEKLDTALALAPLLSVASYLYARGDWLQSARRYDAHFQGYSRSLARHMDRAAQEPELMEALCH